MVGARVGITRTALVGLALLAAVTFGAGSVRASAETASGSQVSATSPPQTVTPTPEPVVTPEPPPPASVPAPGPEPTAPGGKPSTGPGQRPQAPNIAAPAKPTKPTKPKKKPKKPPKKNEFADVPQSHSWAEQGIAKLGAHGIDVSAWEHPDGAAIDWKALRKGGVKWMYTKCSDGIAGAGDYTRWGPVDVRAAEAVGIPSGCYHYAEPHVDAAGSPVDDATAQARAAVAIQPDGPEPTLPLALDLEETLDLTNDQLGAWAKTFLAEVEHLTGRTPWMYASQYYLSDHLADRNDLAPYPIWVAAYSLTARQAPPVPAWAKRVAWQFSSQGHLGGIPSDEVDLNVFVGDPQLLRRSVPAASVGANGVGTARHVITLPALPAVVGSGGSPVPGCAPSLGAKRAASAVDATNPTPRLTFINPGCY